MPAHLAALDRVYANVVRDVRAAIESAGGTLVTDGAGSESEAADMARNA